MWHVKQLCDIWRFVLHGQCCINRFRADFFFPNNVHVCSLLIIEINIVLNNTSLFNQLFTQQYKNNLIIEPFNVGFLDNLPNNEPKFII